MTKKQIIEQATILGITIKPSWTKNKMLSALTAFRSEAIMVIDHHEKHAKSYFWTSPGSASGRRSEEVRKTFNVNIGHYSYTSNVSCSCKNYYYTGNFKENGQTKNLRSFRKLALKLGEIISNV